MLNLIDLISEGENIHQDFKYKIDDQRKIGRTLCAFANTEGGRLLIGVNDKRKIVGCNPEEELTLIKNIANVFCLPELKFTSKVWQQDFRLVLEIDIEPASEKPHKAKDDNGKWKPYIRIGDHTIAANKILESVWNEKRNPTPRPENLDTDELLIIEIIRNEQLITLSSLYRKSNLPLKKVDRIIVLLITWGFVEMHFEKDSTYYNLAETKEFHK